ncbi:MAG: hypothetical protein AB8B72_09380 [Crocinitomicaceae bacterium]
MTFIKILSTVFILNCITSCNNFENKLFTEIDKRNFKKDTFHLSKITDFKWKNVLYIQGNESMPTIKEEIEEILNNRISNIHWEERRFDNKIDPELKLKTTDLPEGTGRFYFKTAEQKLIIYDVQKHSQFGGRQFNVIDITNPKQLNGIWITKANCRISFKKYSPHHTF